MCLFFCRTNQKRWELTRTRKTIMKRKKRKDRLFESTREPIGGRKCKVGGDCNCTGCLLYLSGTNASFQHWNQENWAELKVEHPLQGGGGTVEQGHIFQVINGCRSFFNLIFTLLSELLSDSWRMYLSCFTFVRRKNFYCFVVQISFGIMQLFFVEFTPGIPILLLFICCVDRQSTKGANFALK